MTQKQVILNQDRAEAFLISQAAKAQEAFGDDDLEAFQRTQALLDAQRVEEMRQRLEGQWPSQK